MNKMMLKGLALFGKWIPVVGPLRAWMSLRSKPQFGKNSLKDLAKKEGVRDE
jgi:L-lactate dehydrogenase complex protein LldF